jgi:CRISPR-associated protein Cas2
MAERERVFVFCYDITRDRIRVRVADILGDHAVRVQRSVFEARLTRPRAHALARLAAQHLEPGDSLRVYAVTTDGLAESFAFGPPPLPERQDFYLL